MDAKERFERECCEAAQKGLAELKRMIRDGIYWHPDTTNEEKAETDPTKREAIFLAHYKQELEGLGYFKRLGKAEFKSFATLPNTKETLLFQLYAIEIPSLKPAFAAAQKLAFHNISAETTLADGSEIRGNLWLTKNKIKLRPSEEWGEFQELISSISITTALCFKLNSTHKYITYYGRSINKGLCRYREENNEIAAHTDHDFFLENFPARQRGKSITDIVSLSDIMEEAKRAGVLTDPRIYEVLNQRFSDGKTLHEVGFDMGISHELAWRLENKGLEALRRAAERLGWVIYLKAAEQTAPSQATTV